MPVTGVLSISRRLLLDAIRAAKLSHTGETSACIRLFHGIATVRTNDGPLVALVVFDPIEAQVSLGVLMAKKNPELSAVQQIVTALQSLDSDLQDRVLASVLALLGKSRPAVDDPAARNDDRAQERDQPPPTRPKGLTELLSEKNPGTNSQKIVLFAYYRDKFENQPRFGRADLKAYFAKARLDPPGNYDRDFSSAVEKGWLHENDDQSYITTSGLEAVEQSFEGERTYSKGRGRKKAASKMGKGRKTRAKR